MHSCAFRGAPAVKRLIDLICGGTALLLATIPLAVVAFLIVLDDGRPILYRQLRLGWQGRPFYIIKFRTMRVGVDAVKLPDGSVKTAADDPRVTRMGRLLRRWSLDELPQLLNVVRGEMSLVGPRPDQCQQLAYYRPQDWGKLTVRPGMTGLSQVKGRNAISWKDRKRWDRWYAAHWTLWLDAWILLQTVRVVLRAEGVTVREVGDRVRPTKSSFRG